MTYRRAGLSVIIVCVVSFVLLEAGEAAENSEDVFSNEADLSYKFMPRSSAKAQAGGLEIMYADTGYSRELKAFGKLPIKISAGAEYYGLKNSTPVELPGKLTALTTDIEATFPFFNFQNTYLRAGFSPSFYGDSWDFVPSQLRLASRYYAVYEPSNKLTMVAGCGFFPRYENKFFPIVGAIYKPNDKLTFNLTSDNPSISYSVNNKIILYVEGDIDIEEFVVSKNASTKATLRYGESHAGCGIKYNVNKCLKATLSSGGEFTRTLRYRETDGKVTLKNGIYGQFGLQAAF